jgi:Tol biopolymer transport system component
MLGVLGGEAVLWVDALNYTYERFNLTTDQERANATQSSIDLLPDGTGFVYVTSTFDDCALQKLHQFDFTKKSAQVIFEWPAEHTNLYYPRVSPTNEQLVFLVEHGQTGEEPYYTLQLFNLKTQTPKELVTGYLGHATPVWSPDGQWIAFPRSAPEVRGFFLPYPEAPNAWLGNIWVVSVETGETRQATQIQGAAHSPVWSLDNSSLSFLTHDG